MKQIPNIEETHNGREQISITDIAAKMAYDAGLGASEYESFLDLAHHHQLQKAREETIHRILAIVSSKQNQFTSTYERGYQDCVKNILESIHHYQSKLDKPN